jgi:hypothetical protein
VKKWDFFDDNLASGNEKKGSGNGEMGSGNGEMGSGNGEMGSGKILLPSGNNGIKVFGYNLRSNASIKTLLFDKNFANSFVLEDKL